MQRKNAIFNVLEKIHHSLCENTCHAHAGSLGVPGERTTDGHSIHIDLWALWVPWNQLSPRTNLGCDRQGPMPCRNTQKMLLVHRDRAGSEIGE